MQKIGTCLWFDHQAEEAGMSARTVTHHAFTIEREQGAGGLVNALETYLNGTEKP